MCIPRGVILCFDSVGVGELRRVAFVWASSSIPAVLCVVAAGIECSNVYVAWSCRAGICVIVCASCFGGCGGDIDVFVAHLAALLRLCKSGGA